MKSKVEVEVEERIGFEFRVSGFEGKVTKYE